MGNRTKYKESTTEVQEVSNIVGFYVAYGENAETFNKECAQAMKDKFIPVPGEKYEVYHINGKLLFTQSFVLVETGNVEIHTMLKDKLKELHLVCETDPDVFNEKCRGLFANDYRSAENMKVRVGTEKNPTSAITTLYFTMMFVKVDKQAVILSANGEMVN